MEAAGIHVPFFIAAGAIVLGIAILSTARKPLDAVTDAAARFAAVHGRVVHVVHAQESVTAGDASVDAEDASTARHEEARRTSTSETAGVRWR